MTLDGWPLAVPLCWLFVLGAILGSFLNVCIHRIPQHDRFLDQIRGLWRPPSSCPRCASLIRAVDNIPVLGWFKLRGRCRSCQGRISARYPLVEALNGFLFVLVYALEIPGGMDGTLADSCQFSDVGPQILSGPWSPAVWLHLRYAYHMLMIQALVVATFIDFDLRVIPDGSTLPAMAVGVIGGAALGQVFVVPVAFQSPALASIVNSRLPEWLSWSGEYPAWIIEHPHLHGLAVSLAGLLMGGAIIWEVRLIGFWILRQEAMGFGDVVLMGMIGSFVGWQPVILVFFIAPICALAVVAVSVVFRRDREIPYGPYLSLGTVILLLAWKPLWPFAERVFDFGAVTGILFPVLLFVSLTASLAAMQMIKRLLGLPAHRARGRVWEWSDEWTSADQLTHHANEKVNRDTALQRGPAWPGTLSCRGRLYYDVWRNGRR